MDKPYFLGGENPLWVVKVGERKWKLLRDLALFSVKYNGIFVAPAGFVTDFASIPRGLWNLYPPVDNYDAAAVIHDAGYDKKLLTIGGHPIHTVKEVSDNLFREGMEASGIGKTKRNFLYQIVKIFGNAS